MASRTKYPPIMIAACLVSIPLISTAKNFPPPGMRANLMMSCDESGDPDPWYGNYVASGQHAVYDHAKPGMNAAIAVIGSTPKQIQQQFTHVIETNISNGSTEHIIRSLTDRELASLAADYQRASGGVNTPLLKTLATRLSDKSLLRVASAFDKRAAASAVAVYASPAVRQSFASQLAYVRPMMLPPGGGGGGAAPAPTTDMTLEDIYLEFRTAPVGSLSPASALSETLQFAGTRLSLAAATGWEIGTGINYLIETYDPALGDAIGGTEAGMIDAARQSINEVQTGHY